MQHTCFVMQMRTTINYQYRYGTSTMTAFNTLYKDGGIVRFYRGKNSSTECVTSAGLQCITCMDSATRDSGTVPHYMV